MKQLCKGVMYAFNAMGMVDDYHKFRSHLRPQHSKIIRTT